MRKITVILTLIIMFACQKPGTESFQIPDRWFTIPCRMLNFSDLEFITDTSVEHGLDYYSIKRERSRFSYPDITAECDRGDIQISYRGQGNRGDTTINLQVRMIDSTYKAFYYLWDNGTIDIIGDEIWSSTIDSLESVQFLNGVSYQQVLIDSIELDFSKDMLNRDFFNTIRIFKALD